MVDFTGFLKALELPAKVFLGIFISSLVLLFADHYEFLPLAPLWIHSSLVLKIVAVVSGCLLLASGVAFIVENRLNSRKASLLSRRRALIKSERQAELEKKKSEKLLYLDSLSHEEKLIIAVALRANSISVVVPFDSIGANLLRSKGLGIFAGGVVDISGAAFTIAPYVWKAIQERKDTILSEVPEPSNVSKRWKN
jgi:hypothetical protein